MARLTIGAKALALSILFVLSGPLSQLFQDDSTSLAEDFTDEKLSSNQTSTIVTIPYAESTYQNLALKLMNLPLSKSL